MFTPGRIVGLAVLAALAGGGYWLQQKNTAEAAKPKYRTQTLDRGTIAQRISANGTLNPVTVVNVGTQISGTVTRLHADYNAAVKKGQVLAELDPALLKAQIAQSEANRRSMQATWTLARSTLERNQSLKSRGFISDAALDTARKDVDAAAAQIAALKAQIDRDRTNLSYSVIRSPIDGIVVDRTIDVGQTVAASFQTPTLFKIARDLQAMQIDTSVSEADIGNIKPGMPVAFSVDAFRDREFTGRVRVIRLNPTVQQNVVTYNVVIDVRNDTGLLLPGMTAQVAIVTQRRDGVLRLPNAALRFKPSEDGEAKAPPVPTGEKSDKGPRAPAGEAAPRNGLPGGQPGAGGMIARPGASDGAAGEAPGRPAGAGRGSRVYKLSPAGDLVPVAVRTGIADIRFTELLSDNLQEGDALVVREVSGDRGAATTGGPNFRMRFF
ncbi:MAG: efflux RND transporter periplasmic adaptor subunit [Betaproteobacteria bacterium]|nr:efflux RND transporter periplasmic adaptor subunit [Betaproteobacteria bacterium]